MGCVQTRCQVVMWLHAPAPSRSSKLALVPVAGRSAANGEGDETQVVQVEASNRMDGVHSVV